jgi:hypothetical protein
VPPTLVLQLALAVACARPQSLSTASLKMPMGITWTCRTLHTAASRDSDYLCSGAQVTVMV